VQFLNEVYLTTDPLNDKVYTKKLVSNKDMLSHVWPYTATFDDKSALGFSKWCYSKNVAFTTVDYQRKALKTDDSKVRYRTLWVLNDEFTSKMKTFYTNIFNIFFF
jgi:hypothetical protein